MVPVSEISSPVAAPRPRERQVHILVGCADARDVGQAHMDAVNATVTRYAERGIMVAFHVLRVPGTFVTRDVLADIRRVIAGAEQEEYVPGVPTRYYVYVQVHGVLEDAPTTGCFLNPTPYLKIKTGSPLNCGMLGATGVAVELEEMILRAAPEVTLPDGGKLDVVTEENLRTLLHDVYAYDGYFAGDWIRSIDDLRTHARYQKGVLERAVAADPELRRLGVVVACGIQDYENHRLVRLDCGDVEARFWDDVHEFVHERFEELGPDHPDFSAQAEKQKPLAGLFAMDGADESPRDLAGIYYARSVGLGETEYRPNSLFVLGGSNFDRPRSPFGPYVLAGYYYAVKHLNVNNFMVVGRDPAQVARMMAKLENDPLVALVTRELGVRLIPLTAAELRGETTGAVAGAGA
jgi:hypothetical protein